MQRMSFRLIPMLLLVVLVLGGTGCNYMRARGRDALMITDIGISYSTTPQFAFYFDFFNVTPLGYANVSDARVIGLGPRNAGVMPFENQSWGVLLAGRESFGFDTFDPAEPLEARGDETFGERPSYDAGAITLSRGEEPPPPYHFIDCNRSIHLGFIGIQNKIRPLALANFIVGWFGVNLIPDPQTSTETTG